MGLTIQTAPTSFPVTIVEARRQCGVHVADPSRDDQLNGYIAAATSLLDGPNGLLGQAIMPQTWDLTLDAFCDPIYLPLGPVTAVVSVKYDDVDGAETTLDPGEYTVDLASSRQRIFLNTGSTWPTTYDGVNVVRVQFTAAMNEQDLPAVKQAILGFCDHYFNAAGATNSVSDFERMFNALIAPKRKVFL